MRVIVALLATIIALSTVNLIYMSRRMRDEINSELDLVTILSAGRVDTWSNELQGITLDIADTITALNTLDEGTIKNILNQYAVHHGNLFFIYVATEDGNMYMARGVQYAQGVDPRERMWYKQVKSAGHSIITDPYMSATRNDVMLATAATPIYFGTKMVGAVGVDADVATINEYVSSMNFKDGAYGFIIDSQGNILAHKNEEYMPTVEKFTNVRDVMPELADIIQKPGSKVVQGTDYSGTDMLYSTARLENSKWTVGVAYPKRNLMKLIDRGIRISIAMAFICILFATIDINRAVRKILRPIEKINPVMDMIMKGDFSEVIELTNQEDELGLLQQKMAIINKKLGEIIDEQKYVLGEMERGNLVVEDIEPLPGELNEISKSVNSIKETFNDIISDIQFSAINLQSFAMGVNETSDIEEMKMVFEELSAEANALMEKTSRFITVTTMPKDPLDEVADYSEDE